MHALKDSVNSHTAILGSAIAILISLFTLWKILESGEMSQLKAFQVVALFICTVLLVAVLFLTAALQTELRRTARVSMFQSVLSEAAGVAAQNRYTELVETIPAVVWRMDISSLAITFTNRYLEALSGFPGDIWMSNPRFWVDCIPLEDRENIFGLLESARKGQHVDIEHRMIRPDKKSVWIRTIANISAGGELVGVSTDITQRKSVELALRASEKQLATVLDTLPVSVHILGNGGEVLLSNPAGKKLWGDNGPPFQFSVPNNNQTELLPFETQLDESLNSTGKERLSTELSYNERSILRNVAVLELDSNKPIATIVVDVDVTEVKTANAALRISERKFYSFFEQTLMGVIEWDNEHRIKEWNPAASAIFGFSRDEVIGRNGIDLIVSPEHQFSVRSIFSDLQTGAGGQYSTNENVRKDGSRVTCEWFNTPLKGKRGVVGTMSLVHDISDRTIAEKSLRELSGRLLRAQEEERCRIARELHDDIGQQIAILGIHLHEGRTSQTELYEHVKDLGHSLSKISHELHSSRLDLLGLRAAAQAACQEFSKDHQIQVTFLCSNLPLDLDSEVALCLYRILQEGLHNIQKHSNAAFAQVELLGKQNEVLLRISDDGCGFDTASESNWQGLGLISMRERMHSIGGQLRIKSNPGQGTTVEVVAPLRTTSK